MNKYLIFLFIFSLSFKSHATPKDVIYGEDSRKDLYEVSDQKMIENAHSTMTFTLRGLIWPDGFGDYLLGQNTLQQGLNLCSEVKFGEQPSIGVCSSTLISPKHVLTAGHCMPDQKRCDEIYLSFGYHLEKENTPPKTFKASDVYRCKKLLIRKQDGHQDFALIELDREVTDRRPVELDVTTIPKWGEKVVLIGYPDGIPSKIAGDATIRYSHPKMFRSNVDAFRGNSGSGIFNEVTGKMIGILFKGDRDYSLNSRRGCYEMNVHHQHAGRGEDATTIYGIWPLISPFLKDFYKQNMSL